MPFAGSGDAKERTVQQKQGEQIYERGSSPCDQKILALFGASLHEADLRDADLRNADLRAANLPGAMPQRAKRNGARLRNTIMAGGEARNGHCRMWRTPLEPETLFRRGARRLTP